ncbi:MAG: Gldg family protein [Lachnospiraceae bacterium]|nr:Gldg family protein [Lachnospiraceae bacterium]
MKMKDKRFLDGTMSAALAVAASVIIFLVNMIAGSLPGSLTTVDVTDEKLYSIGDTTKGVLDALTETVTLHYITEAGEEDEAVSKLVDSYDDYTDRIKLVRVDAVVSPAYASGLTDDDVPINSVIAECGGRVSVASYSSFYVYGGSSYLYDAASGWDAEGRITSAVASAAFGGGAKIYFTTGHDEMDPGSDMLNLMEKAGITRGEINLINNAVPDDAAALAIFAPVSDFTDVELKRLRSYLDEGGHLLLVTMSEAVTGASTPGLDSVMASYGVKRSGGYVLEGDSSAYVQAPYLILPQIGVSEVTQGLAKQNIICALPEAIEPGHDDDSVYTVTPLLMTGGSAYKKDAVRDTVEKEESDEEGSFVLAVSVEQTFSNDDMGEPDVALEDGNEGGQDNRDEEKDDHPGAMRIVYCTTPCIFSSEALSQLIQQESLLPEGNAVLFSNVIAYLTDMNVVVSVEAKTLAVPQTVMSAAAQQSLGVLLMFVLPGAVLMAGLFVYIRRRR